MIDYSIAIDELLNEAECFISDIKPSEWAERNIIMPKPFPGPLSYEKTPYTREIIDCFAPDHPARDIAVMGAAQFGKTATIIVPVIGYIMENDPGNIIMTVGHEDLVEEAVNKIDAMIEGAGLKRLLRPTVQRIRNQKSPDKNTRKEFPHGYLKIATANNPKIWRQADYKFGLIDDYEAVKTGTKTAGSTRQLIEKRFTAYHTTRKVLYCSSPELEHDSNILEVYNLGDKRKYLIPCPCCGVFIELIWSIETKEKEQAGMIWEVDDEGRLITGSVKYRCQECLNAFDDREKSIWVNKGYWQPTAKPFRPDIYSYYMPAWYSPHGMTDWEGYVYKWIEANPPGQKRDEAKYQTFLNTNAGLPYIESGETIKANVLQRNTRDYPVGIIPESLSIKDGNGKIVLLTCACDLNGKLEDARLDYEVLGWSESGATYSITHGSIGTFIPNESGKKNKVDREKWTYENHRPNNVWKDFDVLINTIWETDTGRKMKIFITGVDTGYCELQAFTYIDNSNNYILGLKGDREDKYVRFGHEVKSFKVGQSRNKLYVLRVGMIKDDLQQLVSLRWDSGNDDVQPAGFMNFPTPSDGKYLFKNYFSHFEAEEKILDKDNNYIWQKKSATAQNHLFDCRVYNIALRDILLFEIAKEYKIKEYDWGMFVKQATGGR